MPAYTVLTTATALSVEPKWLDNLLSHHIVPGAPRGSQGRARRLTLPAIRLIALAHEFVRELSTSTERALVLAEEIVAGTETTRGVLRIAADLQALDASLAERLAYAVEVSPVPRRGRPPRGG